MPVLYRCVTTAAYLEVKLQTLFGAAILSLGFEDRVGYLDVDLRLLGGGLASLRPERVGHGGPPGSRNCQFAQAGAFTAIGRAVIGK